MPSAATRDEASVNQAISMRDEPTAGSTPGLPTRAMTGPRARGHATFFVALAVAAALAGCQTPCKQLEQRLCERSSDDGACERWKERIGRVSSGTCEIGLRTLDREALH